MISDAELAWAKEWFVQGDPTGEGVGMVLVREVEELRAALRRMIVAAYGDLPRKELDAEIAKARAALGEK